MYELNPRMRALLESGGTVAWRRPELLVDLAAHVIAEHVEVGECVGSCGWRPGDSVVIRRANDP